MKQQMLIFFQKTGVDRGKLSHATENKDMCYMGLVLFLFDLLYIDYFCFYNFYYKLFHMF